MKKHKWIICPCCDGESTVDNPAFSNGFTSSEWHDMHVDEQQAYMTGAYDVPCTECAGLGRVKVPNVAALSFSEKRQLVLSAVRRTSMRSWMPKWPLKSLQNVLSAADHDHDTRVC